MHNIIRKIALYHNIDIVTSKTRRIAEATYVQKIGKEMLL